MLSLTEVLTLMHSVVFTIVASLAFFNYVTIAHEWKTQYGSAYVCACVWMCKQLK